MFGLKLFKRSHRRAASEVHPPVGTADMPPPVSRLSVPPPPPPLGAFASFAPPAAAPPHLSPLQEAPVFPQPEAFVPIGTHMVDPQPDFSSPAEAASHPSAQPGEPTPARVRFFYEDGSVSEADPEESERLGYLANNLLEASRDDLP